MVEAKTAPHIFEIKETQTERAFQDLESQVCDIKNMSIIMESIIQDTIRCVKPNGGRGHIEVSLTKDQFDSMHFAVMHMGDMIRKFHDGYFECFEANKGAKA